jgi:predicted Na+-dependent transporter
MTVKYFIETHFGLVMIFACIAGLIVPGMPLLPNATAVITLALLMLISCYKLRDSRFSDIDWRHIAQFYLLRYFALPFVLWFIVGQIAPDYAIAVFLVTVLPAGVSGPAFANIFNGAVAPAFAVVLASQLLTPLLIPLQFSIIHNPGVTPSASQLFVTLVCCILLPMALYVLTHRHQKSADWLYTQNKCFSIVLVSFVIALAIAKQREVILANPAGLIVPLCIALACFFIYIVSGWFSVQAPREERITYATCSSFNNAALGVSLALLYFPPPVILFTAASEIAWALLPMMMRIVLRFLPR